MQKKNNSRKKNIFFGIYFFNNELLLVKEKQGIVNKKTFPPNFSLANENNIDFKSFFKNIPSFFHESHLIIPIDLIPNTVFKNIFEEFCIRFGFKSVKFVEPLLLAATGAMLNYDEDISFIGNFENGLSEVGFIGRNKIIYSRKIPYKEFLYSSIINYVFKKHNLIVEQNTACKIWQKIGTFNGNNMQVTITGYTISGEMQTTLVTSDEIAPILKNVFGIIVDECKMQIEMLPFILKSLDIHLSNYSRKKEINYEDIKKHILKKGFYMTGSDISIDAFDIFMSESLNLPINYLNEPELPLKGIQTILDNHNKLIAV